MNPSPPGRTLGPLPTVPGRLGLIAGLLVGCSVAPFVTGTAHLAADDCAAYWTGGAGVWSATIAGSGARLLTSAAVASHRLAVDDTHVYWTDNTWIGRASR